MSRYGTGLPLWDKFVIVYALSRVGKRLPSFSRSRIAGQLNGTYYSVTHGLYTFLLSPFRGSAGAKTVKRHVTLAMERKLIEAMTIAQLQ